MSTMGVGLLCFIAGFIALGLATFWLVRGSGKRYVVCGKSLPVVMVVTMLTAQSIDANATLGNSSMTHAAGFWAGFSIPAGLAACLVLTGLFFARPLNRMNLLTLPDFYFRRYGRSVELLSSLLMGVSFVILVAGNFAGSAWIVSVVFRLDYGTALIAVAAAILLYTAAGGLFSSAATDFVQIYPAIIGFVACVLWLIGSHGWGFFGSSIPPGFLDLRGLTAASSGALVNWASFLALALGDIVALDFMERIFAARTPRTAQVGCYLAAGLTLICGFAASFLGLMGLRLVPDVADHRMVLPTIAMEHVPFLIGLLVLAGVIGAGASTANGGILGVSTVLGRNLIQKAQVRRRAARGRGREQADGAPTPDLASSDQRLLLVSRSMAVPVVLLAVLLAWVKPEPGVLLVLAFDVVFAGCLVPLVGGLFWRRANTPGALAAILAGSLLRLILYLTIPARLAGLDTLTPPVASAIVFVAVSLRTARSHPARHHVVAVTPTDQEVLGGLY